MKLPRILVRFIAVLLLTLLVITMLVGGILFWYTHRPLPEAVTNQTLFPGITFTREIRSEPVPQIIHAVRVDLSTPGLTFLTTPRDDAGIFTYAARTTSQFLDEFDVQVAINGDYLDPWWMNGLDDYYPHVGDGTNTNGLAIAEGQYVTYGYGQNFATLYITQDNRASFFQPNAPVYTAISGNAVFLKDGIYTLPDTREPYLIERHPRTAVGLSDDGNTLLLMVIDGRQPNYSTGASFPELVDMMLQYGAATAINLDGGGSSTLVIEGEDGQPHVLNSPIQNRIPGSERPVANHLGVRIRR